MGTSVIEELKLVITDDFMYVFPLNSTERTLIIDRVSEEIKVGRYDVMNKKIIREERIFGIIGVIRLISCYYLIAVTKRVKLGSTAGHELWKLTHVDYFPFARTDNHLTERQKQLNVDYLSLLASVFANNDFYFSYTYDLSHTIQRFHHLSPGQPVLLKRGEQKFIWNAALFRMFPNTASDFMLPIINGFVSVDHCVVRGRPFTLLLISRRSTGRAGVRLFARGIDANGDVANFVETEMIVETNKDRASFVQTRGSMPFYWQQWPNLKYKPRPTILHHENHLDAFNKHFDAQQIEYGRQIIVNLVDQTRSEGKLESFFRQLVTMSGNPNLKYEAFDFHHECSKMRWDRLSILIDRLSQDLEEVGYTLALNDGKVCCYQDGVFRTNCIDCLDRTNVVQSMIGRRSLETILEKLTIFKSGELISCHQGLEQTYRTIWTENANTISKQYSGTGALKTDYTLTGIRSHRGALQDLVRSLTRYYKNNYSHGTVQDGLDLFLGYYTVSPNEGNTHDCPLNRSKDWKYTTFPLVLCVAIAMFFANLIAPAEYDTSNLLSLIFWGFMVAITVLTILINGKDFVDHPKLHTKFPSAVARA